jgi:tRNA-splicing endonuclease subunit Sen2
MHILQSNMMMASLPTPPTMNTPNGPGTEAVDVRATNAAGGPPQPGRTWTPRVPLHTIYALPVPIRTFPLPSFYPNNPISLAHLAYAWLRQVLFPPAAEVYVGVWDPSTRSIHITDPNSIRALWEQGFFGKGNLSRSEPNWLKRELGRRGAARGGNVSEERTESRRQERANAKWERAKAELEVIEQQRLEEKAGLEAIERQRPEEAGLEEARLEEPTPEQPLLVAASPELAPLLSRKNLSQGPKPPVGPLELLALPNSSASPATQGPLAEATKEHKAPVGPAELLALPNSLASLSPKLNKLDKLESRSDSNTSLPTALSHEPPPLRLANGHEWQTSQRTCTPQ